MTFYVWNVLPFILNNFSFCNLLYFAVMQINKQQSITSMVSIQGSSQNSLPAAAIVHSAHVDFWHGATIVTVWSRRYCFHSSAPLNWYLGLMSHLPTQNYMTEENLV